MGNKRKGQQPQQTAAERAAAAEAEELQEHVRHMRQMAEDAGAAGGKASIFRRELVAGSLTGKERFLESVPTRQIWDTVYEYLAEKHGGGSYRVCLKDANGDFVSGAGKLYYDIAGPEKLPPTAEQQAEVRKLDELEKRIEAMTAKGSEASPVDMMRLLMEVTREQLRELRNPPPAAAQGNPMEMAASLVASLQAGQAPLLAALIERASQPAPDMLAQMQGLASMMVTLRELSGDSRGSGWSAVADRLADPLGQLVAQHVQNQQAGTAPPHTMGGAMPNPPGTGAAQQGPPWLQMMRPYLPQLVRYARSGRDPGVVADFVAEELPERHLALIYATLTEPSFPDEFARIVPDAAPHMEWFVAFFQRVLEWIEPPGTPDGETAPSSSAAPSSPAAANGKPEVGTVAEGEPAP